MIKKDKRSIKKLNNVTENRQYTYEISYLIYRNLKNTNLHTILRYIELETSYKILEEIITTQVKTNLHISKIFISKLKVTTANIL